MIAGRGWIGIAAQAMGGTNMLGVASPHPCSRCFRRLQMSFRSMICRANSSISFHTSASCWDYPFSVSTYRSGKKGNGQRAEFIDCDPGMTMSRDTARACAPGKIYHTGYHDRRGQQHGAACHR
jgi:hypothetical protein